MSAPRPLDPEHTPVPHAPTHFATQAAAMKRLTRYVCRAPILPLLAYILWCLTPLAQAASTKIWEISDYKDFLPGKLENISLSYEGRLTPAPKMESVYASDQPVIWAAATAADGSIYLATGHQGRIYKVDPAGKSRLFWAASEIEVFAIAVAPDGTVFAGTSPKGKVYRIDAEGNATEFFDPKQTYIWSLALDPSDSGSGQGSLFVATGENGKIYRVKASGGGEVYFETGQRHVMSLAIDNQGRLLAGTDPNGILYRVDGKDKAFALYDSDLPEVHALQVAPNGDIFAAVMGGGLSQTTQPVPSAISSMGTSSTTTVTVSATSDGADPPDLGESVGAAATKQDPKTQITFSQPVASYGGLEKAALIRVRPGLAVEKLWGSDEENILALSLTGTSGEEVMFATDEAGRVYRLAPDRQVSLVTQAEQDQITQLLPSRDGLLVSTAHSGNLYRLAGKPSATGSYETAVYDAGSVSRWGRLSWRGHRGSQSIRFQTRSGNSGRPDGTWSEWSKPAEIVEASDGAAVESPSARYIQWRAEWAGESSTPAFIESVQLTYLPQNSPPAIDRIEVSASTTSSGDGSRESDSAGSTAAGDAAAYSITVTAAGDASSGAPATGTETTTLRAGARPKLTVSWQAQDPDGDRLAAEVSFRGDGESAWKMIEKDITNGRVSIDSDSLADGTYRFRVKVSDRLMNPSETAQSAQRISEPVLVDHTPPAVKLEAMDGRSSVRFSASDEASILRYAEYSIDAGAWNPVYADDGIVDSRQETFTIHPLDLAEGEHLLTLRVRDRAGNIGLGKAVLR